MQWCWVNFQCRDVLLIWIIVRQGPTALAVGADGRCLDIFFSSITSLFFLPLSGGRPDIDRDVLLIWIIVWQGPTALAVGADGVVWTFFFYSQLWRVEGAYWFGPVCP